jgi:diguanylate cyclase (GGDEF)-like protein
MDDAKKSKQQFVEELSALQLKIRDLEKSKAKFRDSQKMLHLISDAIPILVCDKNQEKFFINQKFEELFGYPRKTSSPGETLWFLTSPDEAYKETIKNQWCNYLKQCDEKSCALEQTEVTITCRDGIERHIECRHAVMGDRIMVVCNDMTEFRRTEDELTKANEKLKAWVYELALHNQRMNLLHLMGEALQVCHDLNDAYAVIKQYSPQLFPHTSGVLYDRDDTEQILKAIVTWGRHSHNDHNFDAETCRALQKGLLFSGTLPVSDCTCRHAGSTRNTNILCLPLMAEGKPQGLMHIAFQENREYEKGTQELALVVTEHLALSIVNLKLRESLRLQAIRDKLTGLFNRRYMEASLEQEFLRSQRNHRPVSIMMLDIDNFKQFNDTYGHDAGDALLTAFGGILQNLVRKEDIACRFGGEEFILILPETALEVAAKRAEHFREELKHASIQHLNRDFGNVTVSLGVAAYPDHGQDVQTVMRKADEALYNAKNGGRNRVEIATYENNSAGRQNIAQIS